MTDGTCELYILLTQLRDALGLFTESIDDPAERRDHLRLVEDLNKAIRLESRRQAPATVRQCDRAD